VRLFVETKGRLNLPKPVTYNTRLLQNETKKPATREDAPARCL